MSAWEDTKHVDAVLQALDTVLDGTSAAASSAKRYRRILNVALEYAVRQKALQANPLPTGKSGHPAPKTSGAVDKRSLLNPHQVAALLTWTAARPRTGHRLTAFYATLYYAGLRPEEAVALRIEDAVLPATGWGELRVHTAEPEVGGHWTDDGEAHETRTLKGRASGDTRIVPVHPALAAILRALIARGQLKPGGLLFPGEKGGLLAGSVYRRAWAKAREAVLPGHEFRSPVGKRFYDLRHTCLTNLAQQRHPARPGRRMGRQQRPRPALHVRPLRHRPDHRTPAAHRRPAEAARCPASPGHGEGTRSLSAAPFQRWAEEGPSAVLIAESVPGHASSRWEPGPQRAARISGRFRAERPPEAAFDRPQPDIPRRRWTGHGRGSQYRKTAPDQQKDPPEGGSVLECPRQDSNLRPSA
ncbi:tyrosine-type recombinase/integrase [Streptomyces catenulae]|uniref:Tyrosine-type recombinase/integrase n=1 Tax=Streptomyces catenulae TaxID=66875 RepID=A0ABV2YYA9_9ACTN|nr:tyrosine-type recombinase/integrase [Streptomyces catenulae]